MSNPTPVRAGEDAGREASDTGTEWFWRIVDSNAEVGLPSIEEDALRLLCRWANRASTAEAEVARLRERLEIVHAYDGEGKQIPFPEGMEHLDGIACRDETIKLLESHVAQLARERDEARDCETTREGAALDAEHFAERAEAAESTVSALRERVARLEEALRLTLRFADFAAGEGIEFTPSPDEPELDAWDICAAVARTLNIELGGPEYMAIIARAALTEGAPTDVR